MSSINAAVRIWMWINRPPESTAPKWMATIGDLPLCIYGETKDEALQKIEDWRAAEIAKEQARRERAAARSEAAKARRSAPA